MSTLQIVTNSKLTNERLDLSALTVSTTGIDVDLRAHQALRVARDGHAMIVALPEEGELSMRFLGFTSTSSVDYEMTAESRFEDQPAVSWTTDGDDVVSPALADEGDYIINVLASPGGVGITKPSTLTLKLRKPGSSGT